MDQIPDGGSDRAHSLRILYPNVSTQKALTPSLAAENGTLEVIPDCSYIISEHTHTHTHSHTHTHTHTHCGPATGLDASFSDKEV